MGENASPVGRVGWRARTGDLLVDPFNFRDIGFQTEGCIFIATFVAAMRALSSENKDRLVGAHWRPTPGHLSTWRRLMGWLSRCRTLIQSLQHEGLRWR